MGILEAMSYGVPVVAFENAGPTGIIDNKKDGLLAKPFSINDFSNNIEKLLTDPSLYKKISEKATEKIKRKFSYETHTQILKKNILNFLKAQ